MKLLSKSVICYFHYLKNILIMIHLKNISTLWILLISSICYNKTSLFQLVAFKIHASHGCHEHLPEPVTERCSLKQRKQKTLNFYTSWVQWKDQCRSTLRKHALLWNKHEYHTLTYFLEITLNHFMALVVLFYTSWNISENLRLPEVFRRHWKRSVLWNGWRVIW